LSKIHAREDSKSITASYYMRAFGLKLQYEVKPVFRASANLKIHK